MTTCRRRVALPVTAIARHGTLPASGLTPRELDVLRLLEAHTDREIADQLFIGPAPWPRTSPTSSTSWASIPARRPSPTRSAMGTYERPQRRRWMVSPRPVSCESSWRARQGWRPGHCLRRAGLEPTIWNVARRLAGPGTGHYNRLRLHTVKEHSALPFLPFPPDGVPYPSRLEVIAYLEAYASTFDLVPRFGEDVRRVYRGAGSGWNVETRPGNTRRRTW